MSDAVIFQDAVIPDFADLLPADIPAVTGPEFACQVCGKELTYGGRGRKPKYCEEHRKSTVKRTNLGNNGTLAAQATEALCQINGLMSLGLMVAHLPVTAETLKGTEEVFREQAYAALLTDPQLCRTILKGGTASGKIALLIAYGMLAVPVTTCGMAEYKMNAAKRREEMANAE